MLKLRTDVAYSGTGGKLTQAGVEAIQGQFDAQSTVATGLDTRLTTVETTLAGSLIKLQSAVAASSQTSIDFTGVPAWVNRITVMFNELSTNGTSLVQVQLGDSGGVETSGYAGSSTAIAGTVTTAALSAGFALNQGGGATAAAVQHGAMSLNRGAGNTWVCVAHVGLSDTARACITAGTKTLSGTLDRVRVTTVIGTDTFDAGSVSISWE